jgi:MarR family transcriptional regulator, organic hydroperoxide resistance regulator
MEDPAPKSDEVRSLAEMLCFAVYSTSHAFNRVYKTVLAPLGLTYPQYLAMVSLWRADQQTVGRLCVELGLESSTLTPLLKRLEAAGLIERSRDAHDERQVRVRLTEAGRALRVRAKGVPERVLKLTDLSISDAIRLHREITTLRDALDRRPPTAEASELSLAKVE